MRTALLIVSTFDTASCQWVRQSLFAKGQPSLRRTCHSMWRAMPLKLRLMKPNPTLNRTCNSVRRPGLISFWPGRRPLPHAG